MNMQVRPLTELLGAEIIGVDLGHNTPCGARTYTRTTPVAHQLLGGRSERPSPSADRRVVRPVCLKHVRCGYHGG